MNSSSSSKPKWSPGGAIRRTSTILSMGRSKTPSRSSSIHESDPSPLRGVAAAPAAPIPKPVPPKSTLSTGSPSKESTAIPSKSTLARMGTALRRPSSLIPRRRTTSIASSFRDGDIDSTPSKTASTIRSSTEPEPVTKFAPTAEPAAPQAPKPAVPEARPLVPESEHVLSPVIESTKTQSTDKPEEIPSLGVVGRSHLSTSYEYPTPTTKETRDEPLAAELVAVPLVADQINTEPEAEKSSLAPIFTAESVSERLNAQPEVERLSLAPISTPEPQLNVQPEAEKSSLTPISTAEPASGQTSAQPEAEEPSMVPHSTAEPVPTLATAANPSSEAEKQPVVSISTTEVVPVLPIPEPTDSAPKVVEGALPSASPATHDAVIEEPPVVALPSPVVETGAGASTTEHIVVEPLREVSSLNSSFEDLALSAQPTEDEVVVVQKDAVVDYPSVLLTPVDVVSVPAETKEKEKILPVAGVVLAAEEPSSIKDTESNLEAVKEGDHPVIAEVPVVPVLFVTQEPRRSPPLEIPTFSADSAAPSPAATHPLLPLEVQETSARQNNGPLSGPVRDHHTKTPQEYRSMLRKLLDGLVDLIRHWRRCLW